MLKLPVVFIALLMLSGCASEPKQPMQLTVSSDLMGEPCLAQLPSSDPDVDLTIDKSNMECLGTLRYMVFGLQESIKRMNNLMKNSPVVQSLGVSH